MKTLVAAFISLMLNTAMADQFTCTYVLQNNGGFQGQQFMAAFKRFSYYDQQVTCNMAYTACEYSRQNLFNGQGLCQQVNSDYIYFNTTENPIGGCFTGTYQAQASVYPDVVAPNGFAHATSCAQSYQNCSQNLQTGQYCVVFGRAPEKF